MKHIDNYVSLIHIPDEIRCHFRHRDNAMEYTLSIPIKGKAITFQGKITTYSTTFTIVAAVKG